MTFEVLQVTWRHYGNTKLLKAVRMETACEMSSTMSRACANTEHTKDLTGEIENISPT